MRFLAVGLVALAACSPSVDDENRAAAKPFADWYPATVAPPDGLEYPCALKAMPKTLDGIPPSHHGYINHAFSLILRAVHARLVVHAALIEMRGDFLAPYIRETIDVLNKWVEEQPPLSLRDFHHDVRTALELQSAFYSKAFIVRRTEPAETTPGKVEEGGRASRKLKDAWAKLEARYPSWSPAVKDSLFHHLCALDVY